MEDYGRFLALLVSALLVGFVSVIFSLVWVFHYREGLSWDGGPREFNWHPVLVITGFVFIQGIGASGARAPGWHGGSRGGAERSGVEPRGSRGCVGPGPRPRGAGRPAGGSAPRPERVRKASAPREGTKGPL